MIDNAFNVTQTPKAVRETGKLSQQYESSVRKSEFVLLHFMFIRYVGHLTHSSAESYDVVLRSHAVTYGDKYSPDIHWEHNRARCISY